MLTVLVCVMRSLDLLGLGKDVWGLTAVRARGSIANLSSNPRMLARRLI